MTKSTYKMVTVAVVGATGAVGTEMLRVLEERKFPVGSLVALASERSVGKRVRFRGKSVKVAQLTPQLKSLAAGQMGYSTSEVGALVVKAISGYGVQ